jgi:hypothetical protein
MCVPSAHDPIAADRNHPPSPGPPPAQITQLCAYHGNAVTPPRPGWLRVGPLARPEGRPIVELSEAAQPSTEWLLP